MGCSSGRMGAYKGKAVRGKEVRIRRQVTMAQVQHRPRHAVRVIRAPGPQRDVVAQG
jgi:hypothetical protein